MDNTLLTQLLLTFGQQIVSEPEHTNLIVNTTDDRGDWMCTDFDIRDRIWISKPTIQKFKYPIADTYHISSTQIIDLLQKSVNFLYQNLTEKTGILLDPYGDLGYLLLPNIYQKTPVYYAIIGIKHLTEQTQDEKISDKELIFYLYRTYMVKAYLSQYQNIFPRYKTDPSVKNTYPHIRDMIFVAQEIMEKPYYRYLNFWNNVAAMDASLFAITHTVRMIQSSYKDIPAEEILINQINNGKPYYVDKPVHNIKELINSFIQKTLYENKTIADYWQKQYKQWL